MSTQQSIEPKEAEALAGELAAGVTLPAHWYVDDAFFKLEKREVFAKQWQYVGHTGQVAEPGCYFTCRAGDVPVIVVRDKEHVLRAFVNVCRHRGSEVILDACGQRNTLQCHYHGWNYDLDGSLRAAPREKQQLEAFDRSEYGLVPVAVDTWGPFVFVNPDLDCIPLREHLQDLPDLVAGTGADLDSVVYREQHEYDIAANWKVVVENFLECYHCQVAHPEFAKVVDINKFEVLARGNVVSSWGPNKNGAAGASAEAAPGTVHTGRYSFVWPSFMLNAFPGVGNVSTNRLVPMGVDRTIVVYEFFFGAGATEAEMDEMVQFALRVQLEDVTICESVQRGLQSGSFDRGRLFLTHENGTQHFERKVLDALSGGATATAA